MRVVLRESVDKLGKIGDIVEVADGYARNYLLPKGIAMKVSPANIARIEAERKIKEKEEAELRARLSEQMEKLEGVSITIPAKASEEGHLYGSVSAQDIARALAEEGFTIEPDMINLKEPIRELGVYEVSIKLGHGFKSECKVWVVAD